MPATQPPAPKNADDLDLSSFTNNDATAAEFATIVKEISEPPISPADIPAPAPITQEILDLAKDAGMTDEQVKGLSRADLLAKVREAIKKPAEAKQPDAQIQAVSPGTVEHPPSLIQAARALGIQDHHIKGASTDFLTDLVIRMSAAKPAPEAKPVPVDEQKVRIDKLEADGLFPPEIIAVMRQEHAEKLALQAQVVTITQEFQKHTQRQRNREMDGAVDAAFNALPPEFEKMFGKGKLVDLPANLRDARIKHVQEFGVNQENYEAFGSVLKNWADKVKAAAAIINPPAAPTNGNGKKPPVEKPKGKLTEQEFDEGALAAAVAAGGPMSERDKTLLQIAKDRFKEWGIDARDEPRQNLGGIPD